MNKHSGYCEVKIGGEIRPIKFGMGAWSIIATERDKAISQMFEGLDEMSFIAWLTYAGAKHAYLAGYTTVQPPKSVHEVFDWIEECDDGVLSEIGSAFAETKNRQGKTMRDIIASIDEDDKKKAMTPSQK